MASNVRIPMVTSIERAIRLYYEKIELGNQDILELFGDISSATISRLKKKAREQMVLDGVPSWSGYGVSTECAYKSWGINIDDIEKRYHKLRELGLA